MKFCLYCCHCYIVICGKATHYYKSSKATSNLKSSNRVLMRNPMSPSEQHSQHNSTLAASPFVSNVSAARTQQSLPTDAQNDRSLGHISIVGRVRVENFPIMKLDIIYQKGVVIRSIVSKEGP